MQSDSDIDFLSQEYKQILRQSDEINQANKEQPRLLAYLWSVICDLYGDTAKIKGHHNVSGEIA